MIKMRSDIVPDYIEEKIKINYIVKKCNELGVCDITAEEIAENNGYKPELLDRVVNALYLKKLGELDNFIYAGATENNRFKSKLSDLDINSSSLITQDRLVESIYGADAGIYHYVSHATRNPKEIIEAGEIKSPVAMLVDGVPLEEIKDNVINARPRNDICFGLDEVVNYGNYVFILPLEDLMKQGKMGFDKELTGTTVHFTDKEFNEKEFFENVSAVWGDIGGGNGKSEVEYINQMKEKIKTAKRDRKKFLTDILTKGIPENVYSIDSLFGYEPFNSIYTKKCLEPIDEIIDDSFVCKTSESIMYEQDDKYIIVSIPEIDGNGNHVIKRDKHSIISNKNEYIIFDREKLLSGIEKMDEKTLDEIISSYTKNIIFKNRFTNTTKSFFDEDNPNSRGARILYALNELGYETGFNDKNPIEIAYILKNMEKDQEELNKVKKDTSKLLRDVRKNNTELEFLFRYKESNNYNISDFGRLFKKNKRFLDYFYSIVKKDEFQVENMNTNDLLDVLDKIKERIEESKIDYLKNCKPGRFKLTENTVFVAPEQEKKEWETYFKETDNVLKRFYYPSKKEFFNKCFSFGGDSDFIEKMKQTNEYKNIDKNVKGLNRVCVNLMTKENGFITDFGAGTDNKVYEFNEELYKYFMDL